MSRARKLAIGAGIGLGILVVVVVVAVIALRDVAADLTEARDLLEVADVAVEDGRLADASLALEEAFVRVNRANSRLFGSLTFDLAGEVPVIRDNLASLRESVSTALVLVDGGRRVLETGEPLADDDGRFEVPLSSGDLPVQVVANVRRELSAVAASLPRSEDAGETRFLLGPVKELDRRISEEAERRAAQFTTVSRALRIVEELAGVDGPRRFLIAVANTAEMRGTGGMILNYGILESEGGAFELGEFGRIDEIQPDGPIPPEVAALPADYLQRWSGFDVTERWRNVNMSGDLPLVAPAMMQLYGLATGESLDGVIQIDPEGLAAILEGTGPVQVAELGEVSAENVVDLTLNEAYVRFPDIDERSDVLGDIAEAAFDRLVNGEYPSLRPLAEAVLERSTGRHIAMFSRVREVQELVDGFGAAATLPRPEDEYVHLGVQNVSANKLDYFVDTALELSGERLPGVIGEVTAEIRVHNAAPAFSSEPRYVFGPNTAGQEPGVYRGVVSLYVPRGTGLTAVTGDTQNPPIVVIEGGRTVVSYTVSVPPQATGTVQLQLRLPPRITPSYSLTAVPSSRVRPTTLGVSIDTGTGSLSHREELDETLVFAPGQEPSSRVTN